MRKRVLFSGALLTAALAAPLAAQQKPADAADVAQALAACREIVTETSVEPTRLQALGWDFAQRKGARSRELVMGLYVREDNDAMVIITNEQIEAKSCVVSTLLAETASYGALLQDLSGIIGMPGLQDNFTYWWTIEGKEIRVDPAGDRKRPLARFEVKAIAQENAE